MVREQQGRVRGGGSGFSVLASRMGEEGRMLAHVQQVVGGIVRRGDEKGGGLALVDGEASAAVDCGSGFGEYQSGT